jgi:hypothetical protein
MATTNASDQLAFMRVSEGSGVSVVDRGDMRHCHDTKAEVNSKAEDNRMARFTLPSLTFGVDIWCLPPACGNRPARLQIFKRPDG